MTSKFNNVVIDKSFRDSFSVGDWVVVGSVGAPSFENSWVAFDGRPVRFRKYGGEVQFEGVVKNGTSSNSTIFTFPSGLRPENVQVRTTLTNLQVGTFAVFSNGEIKFTLNGSTTTGYIQGSFPIA